MSTQNVTATRMAASGVSLKDARWYFTVARPSGFKGPGVAARASSILRQTSVAKH
jgi:predicted nucleic acid-binding Zn ribbon protein